MTELDYDQSILARTLYGEAEANNEADAVAIANVVLNRARHGKQWPSGVAAVCLQPWQFSCWNVNDPNRERILNASGEWFERCKQIAAEVMKSNIDPTNGATHYYATYIAAPKWAKGHRPCYTVTHKTGDLHLFFNDIDTPAPVTARESLEQVKPLTTSATVKSAQVGVVTTGAVTAAAEAIRQFEPALPLAQMLAQYAPWGLVTLLLGVIAYMSWRRIDDRAQGLR